MFDGTAVVVTVGNTSGKEVCAEIRLPVHGAVLLDRVDGTRVNCATRALDFVCKRTSFAHSKSGRDCCWPLVVFGALDSFHRDCSGSVPARKVPNMAATYMEPPHTTTPRPC